MKRTKTEVYSRCCGYLRPVEQWNEGKQAEWDDRISFSENSFHETILRTELSTAYIR